MSKNRGEPEKESGEKAGKSKIYGFMLCLGLFEPMYVFI